MKLVDKIFLGNIVKEAFDNLPSGICFFDKKHHLVLCNKKMYEIFSILRKKELQIERDLEAEIGKFVNNMCVFPDESVWYFEKKEVKISKGKSYTQYIAADITSLHETILELNAKKEELTELVKQMEQISKNILSIVREEEILSAKRQIHSDLGSSILNTRTYYKNANTSNKKKLIVKWKKTLAHLRGGLNCEEEENPFLEIKKIAREIDVNISLDGEIPEDKKVAYLLVCCMRDCITNLIRHANGKNLFIKIEKEEDMISAYFTNDGMVPTKPIKEGCGLRTLRQRIEKNGGSMSTQSFPRYMLSVHIPKI